MSDYNWQSDQRAGFRWAIRELLSATIHAALLGWGLWMLGVDVPRCIAIGALAWSLIISGIAWHKLQQVSLAAGGIGLILWAHIPIVERLLAAAQSCH